MARLFTLIENCRQEGIDPEAYLVDISARLPDYPMKRIAELLPRAWKAARPIPPAPPSSLPDRIQRDYMLSPALSPCRN